MDTRTILLFSMMSQDGQNMNSMLPLLLLLDDDEEVANLVSPATLTIDTDTSTIDWSQSEVGIDITADIDSFDVETVDVIATSLNYNGTIVETYDDVADTYSYELVLTRTNNVASACEVYCRVDHADILSVNTTDYFTFTYAPA